MNILHRAARRLEQLEALDKVARPLVGAVGRAVRPRVVRNLLSGTDLGHPLHPMLTDLPIGAWVMSALPDAVGGPVRRGGRRSAGHCRRGGRRADRGGRAERLVRHRRAGDPGRAGARRAEHHGAEPVPGLADRGRRGRRRGGQALGLAGLGMLLGGGYLGGHLCFALGVEVNRTAREQRPQQWTPVLADTELADGELCRADAGGVPVLLYRTDGTVYAPASTCTHMGGPLREDTISDGCVTCPWPGSTFRFADGSIMRSPASTPELGWGTARFAEQSFAVLVVGPQRLAQAGQVQQSDLELAERRRAGGRDPPVALAFLRPQHDPHVAAAEPVLPRPGPARCRHRRGQPRLQVGEPALVQFQPPAPAGPVRRSGTGSPTSVRR